MPRDLEPENLLYSDYDESKAVLKLADFGLAQLLNDKVYKSTTEHSVMHAAACAGTYCACIQL
jgi:serine/threonine protein kinase